MKKLSKIFALLVVVFSVFALAACKTTEPTTAPTSEDIASAVSYVKEMYKNASTDVSADFTRVGAVGDVTITWSVDVAETKVKVERADTGLTTIDIVDDNPSSDYSFTLTATFTFGEETKTESWTFTVKKAVPMTWAELQAAAEAADLSSDKTKTISACAQGVVTCVISKTKGATYNALYVEMSDGGCFMIDSMTADPTENGIEEGTTVSVKGNLSISYSQYKFTDASVKAVGTEKTPVTPLNIDDLVAAASSSSASTLTALLGRLVTITGATIKAQDGDVSNGYYKFEKGSVASYVRISSSGCPMAKADQEGFKTTHNEKVGWTATVTGIALTYNSAFYLQPVDKNAFVYTAEPQLTDAEKVAQSKEALTITALVMEAGDVTLPTTTSLGCEVAWASDSALVVVAQDNSKATVTMPTETTKIKLTATLTLGSESDTKEFEVVLKVFDPDVKEITADYMGLSEYAHEYKDVTYGGDTYSYIELGNYGAGIQMRIKEIDFGGEIGKKKVSSVVYNKTAFANDIRCAVLNFNTTKMMTASSVAVLYVEFSSTAEFTEATTNKVGIKFVAGQYEYVAIPSEAGSYKYIRISYPTSGYTYAEYWMSINVYTKDLEPETISLPETAEVVFGTPGKLTPAFGPAAAATPELTWTVEDESILTVANGVVTPVAVGSTKVTVALVSDPTIKAECIVTVKDINCGTAEAPLTVAEAYDVITTLAKATLHKIVYVTGVVASHSFNSKFSSYTVELVAGDKSVLLYSANLDQSVTGSIHNGDTVVAYGYTTNYNGTRELTNFKPEGAESDVYPTIASVTKGQYTVTTSAKSSDKATITELSSTQGTNGETITFKVEITEGKIKSVKVNGVAVTANEGVYSATAEGQTEILVKVGDPNEVVATLSKSGVTANTTADKVTAATLGLDAEIFTFTYVKGSPSTDLAVRTDGFRMYGVKGVATGNQITITVAEGYEIVDITINFDNGASACAVVYVGTEKVAGDGGVYEINASSFTLVNDNTGMTSNTQVKFQSIEIAYKPVEK